MHKAPIQTQSMFEKLSMPLLTDNEEYFYEHMMIAQDAINNKDENVKMLLEY